MGSREDNFVRNVILGVVGALFCVLIGFGIAKHMTSGPKSGDWSGPGMYYDDGNETLVTVSNNRDDDLFMLFFLSNVMRRDTMVVNNYSYYHDTYRQQYVSTHVTYVQPAPPKYVAVPVTSNTGTRSSVPVASYKPVADPNKAILGSSTNQNGAVSSTKPGNAPVVTAPKPAAPAPAKQDPAKPAQPAPAQPAPAKPAPAQPAPAKPAPAAPAPAKPAPAAPAPARPAAPAPAAPRK